MTTTLQATMKTLGGIAAALAMLHGSMAFGSPETCAYIADADARLNCFDSYFTPEELPQGQRRR